MGKKNPKTLGNHPWPCSDDGDGNAFHPAEDGAVALAHMHLKFDVANADIDPKTDHVLSGARLYIQPPALERKLGLILVYRYDISWCGSSGTPRVLAMGDYPGASFGPFSLRITEDTPFGALRPIAVKDVAAWRTWWKAFMKYSKPGIHSIGYSATAGDKNT